MVYALVPENARQVHPRQGRPPRFPGGLERPPAPQGHLPQKCQCLRTPIFLHPDQTPQQFSSRRQSQMMNRGLHLRHALKALGRARAIEGVDGEVEAQTSHGIDLVQDKGLGGLRKPQKNIGDAGRGHVSRGEGERFDFFRGGGGPRLPGGGSPWPRKKTGPRPAPVPCVRGYAWSRDHLKTGQGCGEAGNIPGVYQKTCVLRHHRFGKPPHPGGHHRQACRHGLEYHVGEGLGH